MTDTTYDDPGEAVNKLDDCIDVCAKARSGEPLTAADVLRLVDRIELLHRFVVTIGEFASNFDVVPSGPTPTEPRKAPGGTESQRRRFFALVNEMWPDLDHNARDKARRIWLRRHFNVGSSKDVNLRAAADLLEQQLVESGPR